MLLAAAKMTGAPPDDDPSSALLHDIGTALSNGNNTVAIGYCAVAPAGSNGDILFGAYTTAPAGVNGFVNIGNTWCGIRSTGEDVPCPPPVAEPCTIP